tara:strand:- start:216 stop:404 length:189 start_codon:yes stop_codon:yes gene_type:complete
MSKMKAIYGYCQDNDMEGLTEYLRVLGWKKPGYCAEQFLKANKEIEIKKEENNDRRNSKTSG